MGYTLRVDTYEFPLASFRGLSEFRQVVEDNKGRLESISEWLDNGITEAIPRFLEDLKDAHVLFNDYIKSGYYFTRPEFDDISISDCLSIVDNILENITSVPKPIVAAITFGTTDEDVPDEWYFSEFDE